MLYMQKLNRYYRILFSVMTLSAVMLLQGCGGGSDPALDADPTGYYKGTLSVQNFTDTTTVHALINDNRLLLMSLDKGVLYDGSMTITGNNFTTTAKIYNKGTDTSATTEISGTINSGSQIMGELVGSGNGSGSFSLTYSTSVNNEIADVSKIVNGANPEWYIALYGLPDADFEFTVSSPSVITFSNEPGEGVFDNCHINGTITPVSGENIYNVNVNLTLCIDPDANTSYTGFATSLADPNTDDTLLMAISAEGFAVIGDFK